MVDSHGADGVRLSTRATMTDGATRCRLLLLEIDDLECHLRFPALRCACTGWPPRCARYSSGALFPRPARPTRISASARTLPDLLCRV